MLYYRVDNAKCENFRKSVSKINSSFFKILNLVLPTRYISQGNVRSALPQN